MIQCSEGIAEVQWWENAPGWLVRAAPLDRIYGHEGKRRRYRRLINVNYPQDTPSNTFGPVVLSGVGSTRGEAYWAPILISCRLFEWTVRLYHPILSLFTLQYLRLSFFFYLNQTQFLRYLAISFSFSAFVFLHKRNPVQFFEYTCTSKIILKRSWMINNFSTKYKVYAKD